MHPQFDQASNLTGEVIASAIAVHTARAAYQFPRNQTYGRVFEINFNQCERSPAIQSLIPSFSLFPLLPPI